MKGKDSLDILSSFLLIWSGLLSDGNIFKSAIEVIVLDDEKIIKACSRGFIRAISVCQLQ